MKIAKIPKAESKTVEFKKSFNQDTIESLVAFANADGGSVYVGVRDDGKVLGVQLANESETAWVKDGKPTNACYIAFAEGDVPSTLFQTGRFKGDQGFQMMRPSRLSRAGRIICVRVFMPPPVNRRYSRQSAPLPPPRRGHAATALGRTCPSCRFKGSCAARTCGASRRTRP